MDELPSEEGVDDMEIEPHPFERSEEVIAATHIACLLLNATSTFPVMEQAERHIISKKLRKGPDFAEQKMAD